MADADIKKDFEQAYKDAYQNWGGFLSTAEDNMKVFLGDQLTFEEKKWLNDSKRSAYVFNKVARFMYLISGYEIRDRHILKIVGTGGEDDQVSSQMTGLIMNAMSSQGGYDVLSDAFLLGPLVSGANLIELFPDRSGDIQFSRLGYNEFLLDPNFTKLDLSDCQYIPRGKWMHEDQIKKLLPFMNDKDFKNLVPSTASRWNYLPGRNKMYGKELRLYEEFWRRGTRKVKKVVIRDNNMRPLGIVSYEDYIQQAEDRGMNKMDLVRHLKDAPNLSTFTDVQDTVKLSILVDGEVVYDGDNPTGLDDYNYVLNAGIFVPEYDDDAFKLQGLMMRAKDPQRAMNRRMCQIIDIVEKRIQEGIIAKNGTLVNPQAVYKSGQGLRLWVEKDMPGPVRDYVHQMQPPDIPPGMFQLYDMQDKETVEILGLNQEILGSDDKDIPGILHKYRTGAALTGMQPIFKNYRQCKRQLGIKQIKYFQKNYRPHKVQRILNEQPAKNFYDPDISKYDCQPVEGLLTDSQRQLAYSELKALKVDFPDLGITGDILLKLLPLQLPNKIKELIQQNQQQQQKAQKSALEQQQRDNKMQEAITSSELAQGQERMTQSAENRSSMALDRAKTAETIGKIEDDRLLNVMDRVIKLEEIRAKGVKNA